MGILKDIESIGELNRIEIEKAIASGNSSVSKFYDDGVIFITGASGFLGKHLVSKLLSSTNLKKIYILLRPKKDKNVEFRFKSILDDPVFELLRNDKPDFESKIFAIEGDMEELNLGMAEKDWSLLIDEVNVIFHSAATVNFEETVKKATLTNVRGTREIVKLAKSCKQLKSIVHVSTAYSHATKSRAKGEVKEDFYPSPYPPEELIELAENLEEGKLDDIIKSYMSDWPNSYTFTKAVTEELLRITAEDLPLCIVRPAIVISAYREPVIGWVDVKNTFGPSGVVLGGLLGILHVLLCQKNINIDYVPVDIVTNTSIVAACETFTRYRKADKQTCIFTVTNTRNPIKFKDFYDVINTDGRKIVTPAALWYCYIILTSYKPVFIFLTWLLHYIPAAIVDGGCTLVGAKPRLLKIYRLVSSLSNIFIYFINNEWTFRDTNLLQTYNKLSDVDKKIYNMDMATIDVRQMILIWFIGVRKYIIKDDIQQTDYAIQKQRWLKIAHFVILPLYLLLLFGVLYYVLAFICGLFV